MPEIKFTSTGGAATVSPGPMCRAITTAVQSFPNGAVGIVTWGTTVIDTDSMWGSGDPTKITIPEDGDYLVIGDIYWAINTTGRRISRLTRNGTVFAQVAITAGGDSNAKTSAAIDVVGCVSGDYIELVGFQDSGGTLGQLTNSEYTFLTVKKIY